MCECNSTYVFDAGGEVVVDDLDVGGPRLLVPLHVHHFVQFVPPEVSGCLRAATTNQPTLVNRCLPRYTTKLKQQKCIGGLSPTGKRKDTWRRGNTG